MKMFADITDTGALNVDRSRRGAEITAALNAGKIDQAEYQRRTNALADAYEAAYNRITSAIQRAAAEKAIQAAHDEGFADSEFATPAAVDKAAADFYNMASAGTVPGSPEQAKAIDDANRVSLILSNAFDAYERVKP